MPEPKVSCLVQTSLRAGLAWTAHDQMEQGDLQDYCDHWDCEAAQKAIVAMVLQ